MSGPDDLVQSVLSRHEHLKTLREPWEDSWKDITDFVLPRRSIWDLDAEEGSKPAKRIYNSTALFALDTLASGIVGYAIAPSIPWFHLRLVDFDLQKLPYVADWLEECERRMYAEFARSNFYSQAVEYVTDAASIGHATMFVIDDVAESHVSFSTRHPKEIFIANGPDGLVDTVYREFRQTARSLVKRFGDKVVSPRVKDLAERNSDSRVPVLHAVYPAKEHEGTKAEDKEFASVYLELGERTVLEEKGFEEFPYAVTRWRTNSDETYGRSPAGDALPDILMLNQVTRTRLNLAQLVADPPYNIPDLMRGRERLVPHGYNYYGNPQEIVQPVAIGGNYPITADVEARIERNIKEHFHVDFFLMLSNAEREMTAREVVERQGEKAAILGSLLDRINQEFLKPVIERTFAIMRRQGRLPLPPEVLIRENANLQIDFVGPLSQAQRKYLQTSGILQSLELIGPMTQINPAIVDNIDTDQLFREAMDAYGMPQKAIREQPEVDKIREARAKAQEKARQEQLVLAQQQQVLQNLDKLNKPRTPGSMLNDMADQVAQAHGAGGGQ